MSRRISLAAGAAGVLLALGLITVIALRDVRAEGPEELKGKPAPDFTLNTTMDKTAVLSQLKGKVVVIDFWATWCGPCRASLPHIQALSADKDKFKEGLRVLAVNNREDRATIETFLKENKYTFVVPMDTEGKAMEEYRVEGIPTTIVIGRDGTVRAAFVGFDEQGLTQAIDAAMKEK